MPQLLVVDDDELLRSAYKAAFEAHGFSVNTAPDGKSGLEEAKKKPQVILVDMIMPFMGGMEFVQNFKPAKHPETAVFVLTNSQVPADSETELRKLGIADYLHKASLTPTQLVELVNGHLGAKR